MSGDGATARADAWTETARGDAPAVRAPHIPGVIDLLTEVLADGPPKEIRARVRLLIGMLLEPVRQRQALAEAVEDLGEHPELAALAMLGLGLPSSPGVPLKEHVAWLDRALLTAHAIDDPASRASVLGKAAMALTMIGDPRWARLTERLAAQSGGAPGHRREVAAFQSAGEAACYAGRHEMAERLLTAALRGAAEDGGGDRARTRLACRRSLALLGYCRGSWDGLEKEIAFLLDELGEMPGHRFEVEALAACLALARGDLKAATGPLADLTRRAPAQGAHPMLPLVTGASIRLAMAQGDVETANAVTSAALAAWEARELPMLCVRALPAMVEAMVAGERIDEAAALVSRLDRELYALDVPLAPPALRHARGFLATGSGASGHFLTAAAAYDLLLCPYEAAQARERAAGHLFALGDPRAADTLTAAMAAYAELGARWDLDRTTRTARLQGLPSPARHRTGPRGYGSALSPREAEVAELASTGLTNREIARGLFLATKTVDKHLSAALRKLGLHSRTALARHLGGTPPP